MESAACHCGCCGWEVPARRGEGSVRAGCAAGELVPRACWAREQVRNKPGRDIGELAVTHRHSHLCDKESQTHTPQKPVGERALTCSHMHSPCALALQWYTSTNTPFCTFHSCGHVHGCPFADSPKHTFGWMWTRSPTCVFKPHKPMTRSHMCPLPLARCPAGCPHQTKHQGDFAFGCHQQKSLTSCSLPRPSKP